MEHRPERCIHEDGIRRILRTASVSEQTPWSLILEKYQELLDTEDGEELEEAAAE